MALKQSMPCCGRQADWQLSSSPVDCQLDDTFLRKCHVVFAAGLKTWTANNRTGIPRPAAPLPETNNERRSKRTAPGSLESPGEPRRHHQPFGYFPFGSAPRLCLPKLASPRLSLCPRLGSWGLTHLRLGCRQTGKQRRTAVMADGRPVQERVKKRVPSACEQLQVRTL